MHDHLIEVSFEKRDEIESENQDRFELNLGESKLEIALIFFVDSLALFLSLTGSEVTDLDIKGEKSCLKGVDFELNALDL